MHDAKLQTGAALLPNFHPTFFTYNIPADLEKVAVNIIIAYQTLPDKIVPASQSTWAARSLTVRRATHKTCIYLDTTKFSQIRKQICASKALFGSN